MWKSRCDLTTHLIIECDTVIAARRLEKSLLNYTSDHKIEPMLLHGWRGGWTEAFNAELIPELLTYVADRESRSDPTGGGE